ncbi:hypothetical protein CI109_102119 [Kwoniella shandongensis]|uniref:Uncharacterized protein n=1 Tax=Kwoniella shandongensis TaxID=1734106 RepID=A0A5M6BYY2_9TREE|nr:uncharacterized protein CI109_003723 [Kwoniella shandongensis]KAA5528068.1 hypothetical protein CI109_003723 [Kwoniella shandongensis]
MHLKSAITTLALLWASSSLALTAPPQLLLAADGALAHIEGQSNKVNLSLFVMSRCPDARLCEDLFEEVFKTDGVFDKVNLDMNYIGHINKTEPLGVSCKHGPIECLGNAHQLCAYHHLPIEDYWAFVQCQNFPSSFPKEIGELSFAKRCIETIGADWWESGVGECAQGKLKHNDTSSPASHDVERQLGKEGRKLLRKNIKRTVKRKVERSCTIEIQSTLVNAGKRTCAVDGGVWSGCDDGHTASDFVRVIEAEWKNLKSQKD